MILIDEKKEYVYTNERVTSPTPPITDLNGTPPYNVAGGSSATQSIIPGQIYGEPPVPPRITPLRPSYTFKLFGKAGWRVYDPLGGVVFDVRARGIELNSTYTPRWRGVDMHQIPGWTGVDIHRGHDGPCLVTLDGLFLTMGSWNGRIEKIMRYGGRFAFTDPREREYVWDETATLDQLLISQSKAVVAEGDVNIIDGSGCLWIVDLRNAPELHLIVASYVDLLRRQIKKLLRSE